MKKESRDKQLESFSFPSDNDDDPHISDKASDSYTSHYKQSNKIISGTNLDLSESDLSDYNQKKDGVEIQKDRSPILINKDKIDNKTQIKNFEKDPFRRIETFKTSGDSNLKSVISPDRNPYLKVTTPNIMKYKQPQSMIGTHNTYNLRGNSLISQGGMDMVYDEDSTENQNQIQKVKKDRKHRKDHIKVTEQYDHQDPFPDSILSAIKKSDLLDDFDKNSDSNDENTARQLIQQDQIKRDAMQTQFTSVIDINNFGSQIFSNFNQMKEIMPDKRKDSKEELINTHKQKQEEQKMFIQNEIMIQGIQDRSRSPQRRPSANPRKQKINDKIVKSEEFKGIRPVTTEVIYKKESSLKKSNEQSLQKKLTSGTMNNQTEILSNPQNWQTVQPIFQMNRIQTDANDYFKFDENNKDAEERSCLLDESMIRGQLKMPYSLGTKVQLQEEIGHFIQTSLVFEDQNQINTDSFYRITDQDSIEKVEQYHDKCPLLSLRKTIMKVRVYATRIALAIISHRIFDSMSILVIIANCFFLALDDPTSTDPNPVMDMSDYIFQGLYTAEMILKISGLGFALNNGSYLRDPWNILDFVIVVSGYATFFISDNSSSSSNGKSGTNISALRSFRVLRPLRTISGVEGLRVIVSALMSALPLLRDTILVLMFFFFIFAIAGVQLFQGVLKNRCVNIDTGVLHPDDDLCGGGQGCPDGYFCGKQNHNPNWGFSSCDNIMYSLLVIFTTVTLEGYTVIMVDLQKAVAGWVVVFFEPIIFIGSWFLLNLTLAVIKSRFTEEHKNKRNQKGKKKKKLKGKTDQEEEENKQTNEAGTEIKDEGQQKDDKVIVEETSPEQKRHIKNKIRIENLLKRLDIVMKQKEVHDKIEHKRKSPRNEQKSLGSARQKLQQNNQNELLTIGSEDLKQGPRRSLSSNSKMKDLKEEPMIVPVPIDNYADIFNNKLVQYQKCLDSEATQRQEDTDTIKIGRLSAMDLHKVSGFGNNKSQKMVNICRKDEIVEDDEQAEYTKIFGEEVHQNDYYNKSSTKDVIKTKMNQIKPQPIMHFSRDHFFMVKQDRPSSQGRVNMKGIANITKLADNRSFNKSLYEKHEKHELYDKIAQLDLLNILNLDEENEDTTNRMEEETPNARTELKELMVQNQRQSRIQQIRQKGIQIKGLDLRNQAKVALDDSLSMNSKSPKSPNKEQNEQQKDPTPSSSNTKSAIKRRKTFAGKHTKYEHKEEKKIDDEEEEEKSDPKKSFKAKAKDFISNKFRKKKMKKSIQQIMQNFSKSMPRQTTQADNSLKQSLIQQEMTQTFMNKTVKARSETRKRFNKLKELEEFQDRNNLIKRKRNKFFAQSIKNIGKTRDQILKDKNKNLEKKRLMQLGGGFENLPLDSPQRRRTFLRSGSTIGIVKSKKESQSEYMFDDELQRELENIKKEEKKKKDIIDDEEVEEEQFNDSSLDIDEILREKKKKIILKDNKYNFTSQQDIFEIRGGRYQFVSQIPKEQQEKIEEFQIIQKVKYQDLVKVAPEPVVEIKPKPKEEVKDKKLTDRKQKDKLKMKGYQKKIMFMQKQNFEELVLEEAIESDDNQDTVLKRLEDEYNVQHRSNIHVTGTISIVINEHKQFKKMMNNTYFNNIHSTNSFRSQRSLSTVQGKILDSQGGSGLSMSYISAIDKDKAKSFETNKLLNPQSAMKRTFVQRGGLSPMLGNAFRRKMGCISPAFKRMAKSQIADKNISGKISASNNQQQNTGPAPKPQLLTDKQILKKLNQGFQKSTIFKAVNKISKLPQAIKRDQSDIDNRALKIKKRVKKEKKGVKPKSHKQEFEEEDSGSSTDDQIQPQEDDFFIDREMRCCDEIMKAKQYAITRARDNVEWSGQDVMSRLDPYKAKIAINALNDIRVWPYGLFGYIKRYRVMIKNIMQSSFIENLLTLSVAINTVILTIDHYGIDEDVQALLGSFNKIFTIIFALEMGLKIVAIGVVKYLQDKMNYLDGIVVILSLVEIAFLSGGGTFSAFRAIRIFRTFRVLRVARLLRSMKSMMNILSVISRSISSFAYLAILLFLFIFIYALLGMQLFGGQFNFDDGTPRQNFDSFSNAFVTSFIVLTMENWTSINYSALRSGVHFIIVTLYFVSWIFIGNYMLLNLFLSILLDSFTAVEEEDHETQEKRAEKEKQKKQDLMKKSGEQLITEMQKMQTSTALQITGGNATNKKKRKKKKDQAANNILDESIDLDIETLTVKKEEEKLEKQPFEGIHCEISYFLFSKTNKIRQFCYYLTTHRFFETGILILIVLSSIKLIYDTYLADIDKEVYDIRVDISNKMDYFFTVAFALESLSKSISMGFLLHKNTYLRETWNQLDFFIVTTSIIDTSFTNVNMPIIKILRLLRILRPLRFISHNSSMKTVVVALLQSMGAIFNVGIVVVLIFLVFAILGVNMFGGKLQYCDVNTYKVKNERECVNIFHGTWLTYRQNFDNVPRAMLTLFVLANQEGWPDIMNTVVDNNGVATGPRQDASPSSAYFFVIFIFLGSFFFMNLFVGVIFMNFEAAQRDEKEALLLDSSEIQWVDMMKMIVNTKPEIIKAPKNIIRKWAYDFTKPETKFDFAIMICIISNMLLMAINYEGQPQIYTKTLEKINYFFTAVFAFEATLKIIGQGTFYFQQSWNKFDFFVVSASFIDIAMGNLKGNSLKFLRVGPQLARVLRVLRVSRLFRLLNKYRGLQALLQTIMFSLPSLLNVLALLMLVFFIYAVLGVNMFGDITDGVQINEYMNFNNFGMAMIILLRCVTGEDWPTIMYDTMNTSPDCIKGVNCGTGLSPLFFFSFIMICYYVMLNLFILIILQQFELYYLPEDNILQKFRSDLIFFKFSWNQKAKDYEGLKIRSKDLMHFFKSLKGNLGMHNEKGESDTVIMRNIVKMNLESDEEGFIYFNELLFKAMKRIYGQEKTKKKVLANYEYQALQKLQNIKAKMIVKSRKNERFKVANVNPFLTVMYLTISFKSWLTLYQKNLEKRKEENDLQIDRESSDEDITIKKDDEYEYEIIADETVSEDENEPNVYKEIENESPEQYDSRNQQYKESELDIQDNQAIHMIEESGFKITLLQAKMSESSQSVNKFVTKSPGSRSPVNSQNQEQSIKEENHADMNYDYNSLQPLRN